MHSFNSQGKVQIYLVPQCHAPGHGHCFQFACESKTDDGLFRKWNLIINMFPGLQLVESLADS